MAIGSCSVCVQGIRRPDGTLLSEDFLFMTFENSRIGGVISRIDIEEAKDQAWITFEELSSVDKVLAKKHFNVFGCELIVTQPETAAETESVGAESAVPLTALGHQVNYLSMEKTYGATGRAFASAETTPSFMERRQFPAATAPVAACKSPCSPGQIAPTTVLIENVTVDEDMLEMLIEHPKKGIEMDGSITSIDIDCKSAVATVNFSAPTDAQKLLNKEFLEHKKGRMIVKKPVTAHPSAVLVTGIWDAMDDETLELYFSNPKKSGGDDIVELKFFEPEHGFAVIIYADVAAAEAVIQKKFHYIRKRELLAMQWIPGEEKKLRQIIKPGKAWETQSASYSASVSGPGREDYKVTEAEPQPMRSSKYEAPVAGADVRDRDAVDRPCVTAERPRVKVEESEEEEEEMKSCTILVEGLPLKTKEETIRRFFQSRTMSGGGPKAIESVSQRDEGTYLIVFNDRASVDRVLKRDNLTLDNNPITVKEVKSPSGASDVQGPTEPLKIFVYGDLTKLTRDALILYLEEEGKATVEDVMYGIKDRVAMVTFTKKFDYLTLRRELSRKPVEDVMLGVGKVACSSTIQVYSRAPVSDITLKMYFESEKYSGGAGDVRIEKLGEHVRLVHFQNPAIAQKVARRRHKMEGEAEELLVTIYHEPLGVIPPGYDTSKPSIKIPADKVIKVDPLVVKYVREAHGVAKSVNDFLEKCHGRIDLSHQNADEIKIKCDLKEDMEEVRALAELWENHISDAVQTVMGAFDKESVPCLPKFWREIYGRLQDYKKSKKEAAVMIAENEESYSVDIIGPAQYLKDVLDDVERICQEVQESQESVTDDLEASIGKLEVLQKMGMENEIKREWPKISVKVDKKAEKIVLKGRPTDMLQAMKYLHNKLKVIDEHDVPMSKLQINVIGSPPGWQYIKGLLKKNDLITAIECDTEKVIIIGPNDQIQKTESLLKNEIIESTMKIEEESAPAVRGKEWDQFIRKHLKNSDGKLQVEMSHDLSAIKIATTTDQYDQFKETLVNYLKTNTVKKQFITARRGCMKLLNRYSQKDLKQIEMNFISFAVNIQAQQDADNQECGFSVTGLSEGFDHAVTQVKDLVMSIVSESQLIRQPGLPKFLMSEGSTMILCGVENTCEVVIEVMDVADRNSAAVTPVEADPEVKPRMTVLDSVNTEQGVTIKVIIGDLTEHHVDAIVNPANQRLQHSGGLAGALVQKGGRAIQQESDEYININGSLKAGDAMMTKAGSLPCKRIIHTVGPHWAGGRKGEEDILYDCAGKCLELAQREDLRTIAFPAIGTGIFGVPTHIATGSIAEAVFDYLRSEDDCEIKEIHLVDEKQDTASSFVTALKGKFGTTEKTKRSRPTRRQPTGRDNIPTRPQPTKEGSAAADVKVDTSLFTTKEGIKITLIKGEIAKQTADAIVNSVPSNLNLASGALSNSIMAAMDDTNKNQLQAEANLKKGQGVPSGGVVTTGAGNLNCQRIFHMVLSQWQNDPSTLQKALDTILSEAHQTGFTSLAIPAVGTGNLRWPADVVASSFYDAVIKFSANTPNTQLKTIYFVIYPADANSVAGFEGHLQTLGGKVVAAATRRTERRFAVNRELEEPAWQQSGGAEGGGWVDLGHDRPPAGTDVGELQIGFVTLQVTTGDITKETTDAIVNSSNARLDVSLGGVSQALAKAGGHMFVSECLASGGVKPNDVAVTGSGNLKCKAVLHFDANSVNDNWKNIIMRCLQVADTYGLQSVTFPALGTGVMGRRPESMANCMMEAIAEFAKSGSMTVNLVRVVIFQTTMLKPYFDQMEKVSRGKPSSLWGKFKKWIGYGDAPVQGGRPSYYSGNASMEGGMRHSNSAYELGVSLDIFAFKKRNIEQALEAIDKLWSEQKADQILGGAGDPKLRDIIKKLDTSERKRIEAMGQRYDVRITVDAKRKAAQIRIQGQLKDASVVESQIRKYLHQIEMEEHEKEEAQLLCQFVQWEFRDRPGMFIPYPEEMNGRIEKAYAQKKSSLTWMEELESGGQKTITLDLINLTEKDGTNCVDVRRRDLSHKVGYSLPDSWAPMTPGDRFTKVLLNTTDQEYIDVVNAFQQTARSLTILQIERLQNPTLYRRYVVHKMDMEAERPNITSERMLWHGTVTTVIANINANGFNRSYNGANATVYGKGVYFAKDASYSVRYAQPDASGQRYMYYASVLTGEYCVGNQHMLEPPAKNPAQPNILYDATVDNVQTPSIYVVYLDTQVYPHYLITFR